MATIIMSGKEPAASICRQIEAKVDQLQKSGEGIPGLAAVIVGEDPASLIYVGRKEKACSRIGFLSFPHRLPENAGEEEVLSLIDSLNRNTKVNGILVQLPLPKGLDECKIIASLDPEKDIDGLHPNNLGRLLRGEDAVAPCTPRGIMELLAYYNIPIEGQDAVVVGRSNLVGKPLAVLLAQKKAGANATVTICHTRTRDLASHTRQADILVAAAGTQGMITADMVKPGAAVVDVGIHEVGRSPDGKRSLVGDVDFEAASLVAGAITPVPGGVGPMTIAMLLKNTLEAFLRQKGLN